MAPAIFLISFGQCFALKALWKRTLLLSTSVVLNMPSIARYHYEIDLPQRPFTTSHVDILTVVGEQVTV